MSGENETKIAVENEAEVTEAVAPAADNEEKSSKDEFISEFAPEPIKIPNYNKEKEMRKIAKANEKSKKRKSKKSKKRRKMMKKIVFVTRSVLLYVLLLAVITATVSVLLVKMNTSEYSIKSAIRSSSPETFMVGKIKTPAKINLKPSSNRASIADILRDNSLITVTYSDIKNAVMRSTYPDFVANVAHGVVNYYIYGEEFDGVEVDEISQTILDNVSYIKPITGVELGESACRDIAEYMAKSKTVKGLWTENLANQKAALYTEITSMIFSTTALICIVIALMLLMVLTILLCKGFAHKMIGWAAIVAGVLSAAAGFFFKPMFIPAGEFVKSVLDALVKNFNHSALLYGAVAVLAGILVLLIGRAMDEDDYDEYEEDYIDEIEQVSTAQ